MDIHEYQAKALLSDFGMPIARGGIAYSPEQAAYRAKELGGEKWVVKAQVHSGARGSSPEEEWNRMAGCARVSGKPGARSLPASGPKPRAVVGHSSTQAGSRPAASRSLHQVHLVITPAAPSKRGAS